MKHSILFSIALVLASIQSWAGPVDPTTTQSSNQSHVTEQSEAPMTDEAFLVDDYGTIDISSLIDGSDATVLNAYSAYSTTGMTGHPQSRFIHVTPSSLTFPSTTVGRSSYQNITVYTFFISDNLSLSLEGTNKGMFKLETSILGHFETDWGQDYDRPGAKVRVTYSPTKAGTHTAKIVIKEKYFFFPKKYTVTLKGTSVKSGSNWSNMTDELEYIDKLPDAVIDNGTGTETRRAPENSFTDLNALATDVKIYSDGMNVIIESSEEQKAIISDIAGRVQHVNLEAGRNVIPVNSKGVYIVKIGEKIAKLMLR